MRVLTALTRLVLLVSAFFLLTGSATAATLYGKVETVEEGDVITVLNLNRSIKIRLRGIDAPEKDQALADVSRQHLADLILNKFVVVHYTGLGQHGYILGRVMLGEMDVCAQMLRDGAAWYDAKDAEGLSPTDREAYAATEQAARSERRGIWENPAPIAPWDFRRSLTAKVATTTDGPTTAVRANHSNTSRPRTGLDTFSKGVSGSQVNWKTLTPSGFNFSVQVPENAKEQGVIIPVRTVIGAGDLDLNLSEGTAGKTSYLVIWAKGPRTAESNTSFIDTTAKEINRVLDNKLKLLGNDYSFELTYKRDVAAGSMKGRQYQLSIPGMTGLMNIFTRQNKKERQLYVLCVVDGNEFQQPVKDFLNSLTVND